jgi:hypothetical protein
MVWYQLMTIFMGALEVIAYMQIPHRPIVRFHIRKVFGIDKVNIPKYLRDNFIYKHVAKSRVVDNKSLSTTLIRSYHVTY